MITRHNVPVYSICWLNHCKGGLIGTFYEPETKEELAEICRYLYKEEKCFDLIGHTSNIYFLPSYSVDYMVSTRKCKQYYETDNEIICDCGVSVMKLAHQMVEKGIKGFEGLIDLPGTVAASIYGNASCYNCGINNLLISCELLCPNGQIVIIKPEELQLSKRSSSLKRGELKGVILSVTLRKEKGKSEWIKKQAQLYHKKRVETQPGFKDNLGSIYAHSEDWSRRVAVHRTIVMLYSFLLKMMGRTKKAIEENKKNLLLTLLGAKDIIPYVFSWNRYIWKDEKSHDLFWKYHKIHKQLFNRSEFEIEIKS